MTEASDTVATFSVSTSSGAMAEASPPNSSVTISKYPVCEKYAQSEKKQDESRHLRHHRRDC